MRELLSDKSVIFFDVGYTIDYPASGDWVFTKLFYESAADKINRCTAEQIREARAAGLDYLEKNHLIRNEAEEAQRRMNIPVYRCLGDHDFNAFRNNSQSFTRQEAEEFYLQQQEEDRCFDRNDYRLIFLSSYDPQSDEPYGFSLKTIRWLRHLLFKTPKDKRVILFSHVPPVGESNYLGETIRNENRLMKILLNYQKKRGQITAYIHGHIHADSLNQNHGFPIIGIGPMKPEDYPGKKPDTMVTPERQLATASQELFDLLLLSDNGLHFIRYGAGEDLHITF